MNQQEMSNENVQEPRVEFRVVEQNSKGLSTPALVLGIIGICISFVIGLNIMAVVLGILATVFGAISLAKKVETTKALTGLILGVLAIIITVTMWVLTFILIGNMIDKVTGEVNGLFEEYADVLDENEEQTTNTSGDRTKEILEKYLDISATKFEVTKGIYREQGKAVLTVKNTGNTAANFDIEIEAVSASGNRIAVDHVYVSGLGAGGSRDFDIFTSISSDKYNQMKQAKFKITKATKY
jgi:hypothetical protein